MSAALLLAVSFATVSSNLQTATQKNDSDSFITQNAQKPTIDASAPKSKAPVWIEGGALFMKATEDGLESVFRNDAAGKTDGDGNPLIRGPIKDAHYAWNWGFTLSAGWHLPLENWDIYASWLRFYTDGNTHQNQGSLNPLTLLRQSTVILPATTLSAKSHTNLHIDLLNLELACTFSALKSLTLRPHFGLASAWINRSFKNTFTPVFSGNVKVLEANTSEYKSSYEGLGLSGGLDTTLELGAGFGIYNQLALSLLYARQHMSQEDFPLLLGNRTSPGGRFTDSWNTVRPIADISLGLCWAKRLKDDYYKIGFKLAWETLLFFNFNQNGPFIAVGVQAPKSGMLALNGVSGKASFDF